MENKENWTTIWQCPLSKTTCSSSRLEVQTNLRGRVRYMEITDIVLDRTEMDMRWLQPREVMINGEAREMPEDIADIEFMRTEARLSSFTGWILMRAFLLQQCLKTVVGKRE